MNNEFDIFSTDEFWEAIYDGSNQSTTSYDRNDGQNTDQSIIESNQDSLNLIEYYHQNQNCQKYINDDKIKEIIVKFNKDGSPRKQRKRNQHSWINSQTIYYRKKAEEEARKAEIEKLRAENLEYRIKILFLETLIEDYKNEKIILNK